MSDEPEASESQGEQPEAPGAESTDGGGVAVAVREEVAPPVEVGPAADPRLEQRKMRLWLPLLLPLGAIAVVALFTLNISRVFLVASEGDTTPAVVIAIGITLAILIGATVVAALPGLRTSSLVLGMTVIVLLVLLAGSLVLGASLPESEEAAGYPEPKGPAISTLEVDARPDLTFQATKFEVPAGINLVKYIDVGGVHTLVFDENRVPGFQLAVPEGRDAAKVAFEQGDPYVIYCTIPGHRAAGMEAEIDVGPPPADPTAEPGTESPTQTTAPAGSTPSSVPPETDPASQSSTGGS